MKTKPPKNPAMPLASKGYSDSTAYDLYVKDLGPAPEGYRYLKVGEPFNKETDYLLLCGAKWERFEHIKIVEFCRWPCITPVPTAKRDSKGRFAKVKDFGDLSKVKTEYPATLPAQAIVEIDKVLEGDHKALMKAFNWVSTSQRFTYWRERQQGIAKLTADDLDYIRAVRAEFQKRVPVAPPAPPKPVEVPLAERLKKVESIEIRDLDRAIGGDVGGLGNAFLWSSTEQGHGYWASRSRGEVKLSPADFEYLKAIRAEHERRIGKKVPPPSPHAARLETLTKAYEALGKEIAALKAEIA